MARSIGEFLAALRKAHGYTQKEVAERLDVSNRTVSSWECNTALPDILLLPAIAELYGVTADEILAGERRAAPAEERSAVLSDRSEKKLLQRKLAKFTTQAYLFGGLFALGLLFFFLGWFIDLVTVVWTGWQWWLLLLFTGLALAACALVCLIALSKSAETSADDELSNYGSYLILLRRKLSLALCVPALVPFGFFVCAMAVVFAGTTTPIPLLAAAACAVTLALLLAGIFLPYPAVKAYGGAETAARRVRNKKLYTRAALFGLIPCAAALVLAITLSFVNVTTRDVLYFADRASFRRHMESAEIGGTEYYVPLSELSAGLGTDIEYGERYAFDEHIFYRFSQADCTVQFSDMGVEIVAERLTAADGFFVYDLRKESMGDVMYGGNTLIDQYYAIRTAGDTAYYERVFVENFRAFGWGLGGAIVLVSGAVCALVCLLKREKYPVKL